MKKFLITLMIMSLMMTGGIESARAAAIVLKGNPPLLAILPYRDKASKSYELRLDEVTKVSEFVMENLLSSGRFKVVERENLGAIRTEYKLSLQDLTDKRNAIPD